MPFFLKPCLKLRRKKNKKKSQLEKNIKRVSDVTLPVSTDEIWQECEISSSSTSILSDNRGYSISDFNMTKCLARPTISESNDISANKSTANQGRDVSSQNACIAVIENRSFKSDVQPEKVCLKEKNNTQVDIDIKRKESPRTLQTVSDEQVGDITKTDKSTPKDGAENSEVPLNEEPFSEPNDLRFPDIRVNIDIERNETPRTLQTVTDEQVSDIISTDKSTPKDGAENSEVPLNEETFSEPNNLRIPDIQVDIDIERKEAPRTLQTVSDEQIGDIIKTDKSTLKDGAENSEVLLNEETFSEPNNLRIPDIQVDIDIERKEAPRTLQTVSDEQIGDVIKTDKSTLKDGAENSEVPLNEETFSEPNDLRFFNLNKIDINMDVLKKIEELRSIQSSFPQGDQSTFENIVGKNNKNTSEEFLCTDTKNAESVIKYLNSHENKLKDVCSKIRTKRNNFTCATFRDKVEYDADSKEHANETFSEYVNSEGNKNFTSPKQSRADRNIDIANENSFLNLTKSTENVSETEEIHSQKISNACLNFKKTLSINYSIIDASEDSDSSGHETPSINSIKSSSDNVNTFTAEVYDYLQTKHLRNECHSKNVCLNEMETQSNARVESSDSISSDESDISEDTSLSTESQTEMNISKKSRENNMNDKYCNNDEIQLVGNEIKNNFNSENNIEEYEIENKSIEIEYSDVHQCNLNIMSRHTEEFKVGGSKLDESQEELDLLNTLTDSEIKREEKNQYPMMDVDEQFSPDGNKYSHLTLQENELFTQINARNLPINSEDVISFNHNENLDLLNTLTDSEIKREEEINQHPMMDADEQFSPDGNKYSHLTLQENELFTQINARSLLLNSEDVISFNHNENLDLLNTLADSEIKREEEKNQHQMMDADEQFSPDCNKYSHLTFQENELFTQIIARNLPLNFEDVISFNHNENVFKKEYISLDLEEGRKIGATKNDEYEESSLYLKQDFEQEENIHNYYEKFSGEERDINSFPGETENTSCNPLENTETSDDHSCNFNNEESKTRNRNRSYEGTQSRHEYSSVEEDNPCSSTQNVDIIFYNTSSNSKVLKRSTEENIEIAEDLFTHSDGNTSSCNEIILPTEAKVRAKEYFQSQRFTKSSENIDFLDDEDNYSARKLPNMSNDVTNHHYDNNLNPSESVEKMRDYEKRNLYDGETCECHQIEDTFQSENTKFEETNNDEVLENYKSNVLDEMYKKDYAFQNTQRPKRLNRFSNISSTSESSISSTFSDKSCSKVTEAKKKESRSFSISACGDTRNNENVNEPIDYFKLTETVNDMIRLEEAKTAVSRNEHDGLIRKPKLTINITKKNKNNRIKATQYLTSNQSGDKFEKMCKSIGLSGIDRIRESIEVFNKKKEQALSDMKPNIRTIPVKKPDVSKTENETEKLARHQKARSPFLKVYRSSNPNGYEKNPKELMPESLFEINKNVERHSSLHQEYNDGELFRKKSPEISPTSDSDSESSRRSENISPVRKQILNISRDIRSPKYPFRTLQRLPLGNSHYIKRPVLIKSPKVNLVAYLTKDEKNRYTLKKGYRMYNKECGNFQIFSPNYRSSDNKTDHIGNAFNNRSTSPDYLKQKFDDMFRRYARKGRPNGELISYKRSTEWLRDAGIIGKSLTVEEANNAFKCTAGVKVTLNKGDYRHYLKKLARIKRLNYNEIYKRLCFLKAIGSLNKEWKK